MGGSCTWRTWHSVAVCTIVIQGNVTCCGSFRTPICNFFVLKEWFICLLCKDSNDFARHKAEEGWDLGFTVEPSQEKCYLPHFADSQRSREQILYWCISVKNISQQILHFMSPRASLCLVAYATENQLVPFRATEKNYIGKDCSF